MRQGADTLKEASPYRYIAEQGLEATKKHDGLLGQIDLNSWIAMSIQRATENVQSRMRTVSRSWRRSAPRRRSWDSSARSGGSTTRW